MRNELRDFGLTDKEIDVYLAVLHLGSASVQDIAKKANAYRTYTYEVLKSLGEKGVVSYHIESNKQFFEAAPPQKLVQILREKQDSIHRILPNLKMIYKSSSKKPRIEVYEGINGLKTIKDDIINTKKELLVYGTTKDQEERLPFYFPSFIKRRIKENVYARVLTERSKVAEKIKKRDSKECRKIRFFPKGVYFPTTTNVYGDKVAILSFKKDFVGVIIHNKEIADSQRTIFELLWKAAVV